jgi:hypothetical protein
MRGRWYLSNCALYSDFLKLPRPSGFLANEPARSVIRHAKLTPIGGQCCEPIDSLYLKGERATANGVNKFIISCQADAPMYLMAIFDVGENAAQVMTWPVNWLFLDDRHIRIDRFLEKKKF